MQHDEEWHDVNRDEHERQPSHRGGRKLSDSADSEAGADRPRANGQDEVAKGP